MHKTFFTVPQVLSPLVGPHELLDIIAAAEGAEFEARRAKQRVAEAVGRFSTQRGYRMHLTAPEARRIASEEAAMIGAARSAKRRAA